eukprot:gene1457-32833_t
MVTPGYASGVLVIRPGRTSYCTEPEAACRDRTTRLRRVTPVPYPEMVRTSQCFDALCHSQLPLVDYMDRDTRKIWRLVCVGARRNADETVQKLTWNPEAGMRPYDLDCAKQAILQKCPALRTVIIKQCYLNLKLSLGGIPTCVRRIRAEPDGSLATQKSIATDLMPLSRLTSLEELALPKLSNRVSLSSLSLCINLHSLSLPSCVQVDNVGALGSLSCLRYLDLHDCGNVEDISALRQCANLLVVDLSNCTALVDLSALGVCLKMRSLNLSMNCGLADVSALRNCTSLTNLTLDKCFRLEDCSALQGCSNLQNLQLAGCTGIENISFIGGCPMLTNLNLTGCDSVADISALAACTSLDLPAPVALGLGRGPAGDPPPTRPDTPCSCTGSAKLPPRRLPPYPPASVQGDLPSGASPSSGAPR